jgi:hypothetical protein
MAEVLLSRASGQQKLFPARARASEEKIFLRLCNRYFDWVGILFFRSSEPFNTNQIIRPTFTGRGE